jgi:hypothetical protein
LSQRARKEYTIEVSRGMGCEGYKSKGRLEYMITNEE